jgi:hypothetical protein
MKEQDQPLQSEAPYVTSDSHRPCQQDGRNVKQKLGAIVRYNCT